MLRLRFIFALVFLFQVWPLSECCFVYIIFVFFYIKVSTSSSMVSVEHDIQDFTVIQSIFTESLPVVSVLSRWCFCWSSDGPPLLATGLQDRVEGRQEHHREDHQEEAEAQVTRQHADRHQDRAEWLLLQLLQPALRYVHSGMLVGEISDSDQSGLYWTLLTTHRPGPNPNKWCVARFALPRTCHTTIRRMVCLDR